MSFYSANNIGWYEHNLNVFGNNVQINILGRVTSTCISYLLTKKKYIQIYLTVGVFSIGFQPYVYLWQK